MAPQHRWMFSCLPNLSTTQRDRTVTMGPGYSYAAKPLVGGKEHGRLLQTVPLGTGFSFHFFPLPNSYGSYLSSEACGTPFTSYRIISSLPWLPTCDPSLYAIQTTWSSTTLQYRLAIYVIYVDNKFPIPNCTLPSRLAGSSTFFGRPPRKKRHQLLAGDDAWL